MPLTPTPDHPSPSTQLRAPNIRKIAPPMSAPYTPSAVSGAHAHRSTGPPPTNRTPQPVSGDGVHQSALACRGSQPTSLSGSLCRRSSHRHHLPPPPMFQLPDCQIARLPGILLPRGARTRDTGRAWRWARGAGTGTPQQQVASIHAGQ